MGFVILVLFVCVLLGCVAANISIVYALIIGYVLFAVYSIKRGFSLKEVLSMSMQGVSTAKNILITFFLIGIMTALWRAGGVIPTIVCYSVKIMSPDLFVLITFLMNCLVSLLTGTAFGTAATMGSICMTMALALDLNPVIIGGAILSGVFFGDRCSPVSTSALLVAGITKTDLYENIKVMLKSAAIPFFLTCFIYTLCGIITPINNTQMPDINSIFADEFNISLVAVVPAVLIVILAVAKVNVKITMLFSIIASVIVCLTLQNFSVTEILKFSVFGFTASNSAVAPIINGGGIVSMIRVSIIVFVSSSYYGIFRETGLLDPLKLLIEKISGKLSVYAVVLITSIASSAVACNQTLAILLTRQLCEHIENDNTEFAIHIENSAVVVAPLIPWSIACGTPLASSGAPMLSVFTAFFLFLLPLYSLAVNRKRKKTDFVSA